MMQRGFVHVDGRWTHWRAMGRGPIVVMLHESPRSSRSLIPLMKALSDDFCCIALDTPGYGASEPLANRFEPIEAFADATLEALSRLGIHHFQLYGTHTGAAIAVEVALRAPKRVASLLLDGFALFNSEEQNSLLEHYLIPQTPIWDGSHLMRIWSRVRDQAVFFPFYDRSESARLKHPNDNLEFMLHSCLGFLEAGDHYRDGYRAAITYDGKSKANALTVPTRTHMQEKDLIADHLKRTGCMKIEVCDTLLTHSAWLNETRHWFARHDVPSGCAAKLPQALERRFLNVAGSMIYAAAGTGQDILIGSKSPHPRMNGLFGPPTEKSAARWFVDPPGFGTNADADFEAGALEESLCASVHDSGDTDDGFPCMSPDYDGQFLMSSWYAVRDSILFSPWNDKASPNPHSVDFDICALSAGHLALIYGVLSASRTS